MILIKDILPYFVSAVGGVIAWLSAGKLRSAQSNNAWRQFYKDLIEDMKTEIGEMKQEIFMLRKTVEGYKSTCEGCPNKKSHIQ